MKIDYMLMRYICRLKKANVLDPGHLFEFDVSSLSARKGGIKITLIFDEVIFVRFFIYFLEELDGRPYF